MRKDNIVEKYAVLVPIRPVAEDSTDPRPSPGFKSRML